MSITQIREELHEFIDKADTRLLNVIYAMIQADMTEADYQLSDAHKAILDQRIAAHELNPSEGRSWEDLKSDIKRRL